MAHDVPVNQRLPSGPAVSPWIPKFAGNVVTAPAVVMRPMLVPPVFTNHSAPSGPAVIADAFWMAGLSKIVTSPVAVVRPMTSNVLVNHQLPSGPWAMLVGPGAPAWKLVIGRIGAAAAGDG